MGYLVIADRWPGVINGTNDSPKIEANSGWFFSLLGGLEAKVYNLIPKCDLYVRLAVSDGELLRRNAKRDKIGKETNEEILIRSRIFKVYEPRAKSSVSLSAEESQDQTICSLLKHVCAQIGIL